MDDKISSYRNHLILAEQKAQEDFDKTVVSVSGGALGVTFIFLKDLIGAGPIFYRGCLFFAWACWGMSITSVLFSYLLSLAALRKTIRQVDSDEIYEQKAGGKWSELVMYLNLLGGLLFFVGVISVVTFIWFNLEAINVKQK